MVGPVQQVDVVALTAVAGAVERTASMLGRAQAEHGSQLAPGGSLAGWASGAAVAAGVEGWTVFLSDLCSQVQAFGDGLGASAQQYQAADQAAADRSAGVYGRGSR